MMTEYTFYMIECNGKRYVGHTINFVMRKYGHKSDCCNDKSNRYNVPLYQYIRANGGWNSCQMSIIEICNFETKRDAELREEYWRIEKEATLNSHRCYLTEEDKKQEARQYSKINYQLNKDKCSLYNLEYRVRNRDKLNEYDRARWLLRKDKNNQQRKFRQHQKYNQVKLKKQMLIELLKIVVSHY